jgi:hypothetical protein
VIASAVGRVLTACTEDAGRIVLHFEGGQRYEIVPAGLNLHVWRDTPQAKTAAPQQERILNGRPFSSFSQEEREHIEYAERMGW